MLKIHYGWDKSCRSASMSLGKQGRWAHPRLVIKLMLARVMRIPTGAFAEIRSPPPPLS
jgi:hypothetical protein